MDGILFVNVAVLERERKMISKEQLQSLKQADRPYLKSIWEYCEMIPDKDTYKLYLKYITLPACKKMNWSDSFGLEELNYG